MTRRPAEVVHPGELLLEEFVERDDKTISYWAEQLGVYVSDVCDLFACKRDITPELAMDLSKLLGTSASYWLRLQEQWYEWRKLRRVR
jgi:addiction module HigA family antidote